MQRNRYNQRSRQGSPILISMGLQLFSALQRSDYKPPVTIFLILLNVFVHIAPYPYLFGFDLANIGQNCIRPNLIVSALRNHGELLVNRIVLSAIIHVDDMHLYYNMISLCWKGINLEKELGSSAFLKLVMFSVVCSHVLMILMAATLDAMHFAPQLSGINTCAVGFSAVLFSLKYVWNTLSPGTSSVAGVNIPSKYAAWAELVLISVISPNVSFLGHLAGILAGIVYMNYVRGNQYML